MAKNVIIACDFPSGEETLAFLDRFTGGKALREDRHGAFLRRGAGDRAPDQGPGHRIFLDLKLHDIPNTVKKAMAVLSALDVDIVNLHAAGTRAMMEAALEGLTRPDGSRPLLIAVTQLTSTDQQRMESELLIESPSKWWSWPMRPTPPAAGLDGVVCSPLEAGKVHARCGADFLTVTPGVRFADGDRATRSASPPPPGPGSWARTTSWWAGPSPRRRTRWRAYRTMI